MRGSISREAIEKPAPNVYFPKDITSKKSNTPAYVFGSGKRMELSKVAASPGPGTYDQPKDKSIAMLITGRPEDPKKDNFPGPGSYNPGRNATDRGSPSYKVGISQRGAEFGKRGPPGPGTYDALYDPKKKISSGIVFGSEKRGNERKSETPGPG